MFDVGFTELLLIGVIALIVLGPERLPNAMRLLGAWVGKARRTWIDLKSEVEREVHEHELKERIKTELDKAGLTDIKEELDQLSKKSEKSEKKDE